MANPNPYIPSYSFSGWQSANPAKPLPAPQVDNEFANVSSSLNATITALNQIRRSDGKLINQIVTFDSLDNDLRAGYSGGAVSAWAAVVDFAAGINATPIAPATMVYYQGETYVCTVAHLTTALFQVGNWKKIAARGINGTGSGDMLASLNLSDLANKPQARINLGIGNVDNTHDVDKPISTATQAAIDATNMAVAALQAAQSDYFTGCIPSKASNTSIAFTTGVAFFGGKKYTLPALTKLLNATFVAGTGAGMLDTGVMQASKTYFLHSIRNTASGDGDYLASLSLTTPTVPAGWELLSGSRVGIAITNISNQIINFEQIGNEVYVDRTLEGSQTANFDAPTFQPTTLPAGVSVDFMLMLLAVFVAGQTPIVYASGSASIAPGPAVLGGGTSASAGNLQTVQRVRSKPTGGVRLTGTIPSGSSIQVHAVGWIDYQCRRLWA